MKTAQIKKKNFGLAITALLLYAGPVHSAENYPSKPIRLIVPFAAAGSIDVVARPIAQSLSDLLGQQVVVDNRGAGGGIIGSDLVAKAPSDGYTLLLTNIAFAITPSLVPSMPYAALKDFAAVTQLTTLPYLLVSNPGLPATSLGQLITLAKARPGQITFASLGNGSGSHLTGAMLRNAAAIDIVHVPYKGFGALMPDLIAGRAQLAFNTIPAVLPHVRSGKLRALAVTSGKRSPLVPEVPTPAESGVAGFEASTWHGVFAPVGTPPTVIAAINTALITVIRSHEMKERLLGQGAEPVGSNPEQFAAFVRAEIIKWRAVVKASGATVD